MSLLSGRLDTMLHRMKKNNTYVICSKRKVSCLLLKSNERPMRAKQNAVFDADNNQIKIINVLTQPWNNVKRRCAWAAHGNMRHS